MKFFNTIMLMVFFSNVFCQDSPDLDKVTHRPALLAGSWYPADPKNLRSSINSFLEQAGDVTVGHDIIALVVPHAGFDYSGLVAAKGYTQVKDKSYDAIIIIGPSHRASFKGASVFKGDAYTSPLGIAKVDKELAKEITSSESLVKYSLDGHSWSDSNAGENSIEIQIPFIQVVKPDVPIVPIAIGTQDFSTTDALMKAIVKAVKKLNRKVLIIASSDLSHYHDHETAKKLDKDIPQSFSQFDYFRLGISFFSNSLEACGGGAIVTAMMAAEQLGGTSAVSLNYSTSGDIPGGNKQRVVGYFSGAIIKGESELPQFDLPELTRDDKKFLIDKAKQAVQEVITKTDKSDGRTDETIPVNLKNNYAAFVTLKKHGNLRACMGHLFASAPIWQEVQDVAKMSSTRDYRFGPIEKNELNELEYEITILSRMKRVLDFNEIQVGRDGLYIRLKNNTGLLLPQVATENFWDRTTFLENVSYKAGLPTDSYKNPEAEIFTFKAIIIN